MSACPLCSADGGEVLWRDDFCRVIWVEEPDYPGFCRVILHQHIKEMTDLAPQERRRLMDVVFAVEAAVRTALHPDKMNLASLGNMVPHVHWHVIPRFTDDRHFPDAIWARPNRDTGCRPPPKTDFRPRLMALLRERLPFYPG
jgi:diadenosine tetraphosphate (Ap4A) HIT family hydrolase